MFHDGKFSLRSILSYLIRRKFDHRPFMSAFLRRRSFKFRDVVSKGCRIQYGFPQGGVTKPMCFEAVLMHCPRASCLGIRSFLHAETATCMSALSLGFFVLK